MLVLETGLQTKPYFSHRFGSRHIALGGRHSLPGLLRHQLPNTGFIVATKVIPGLLIGVFVTVGRQADAGLARLLVRDARSVRRISDTKSHPLLVALTPVTRCLISLTHDSSARGVLRARQYPATHDCFVRRLNADSTALADGDPNQRRSRKAQ